MSRQHLYHICPNNVLNVGHDGAPGETPLDDADAATTALGTVTVGPAEGTYLVTGTAMDLSGNVATTTNAIRVVLDTTPPLASFHTKPSAVPRQLDLTFVPHCDDGLGCTYLYAASLVDDSKCQTATPEWLPLPATADIPTNLRTVAVLSPGTYELRIRAIDHIGNTEPPPASPCVTLPHRCATVVVTLNEPPGQPSIYRVATRVLNVTFAGADIAATTDAATGVAAGTTLHAILLLLLLHVLY